MTQQHDHIGDYLVAGRTVAATADPWDQPMPAANPRPMLEDALTYAADRIDRLEHVLGDLNGVIMAAGSRLEPILTDGTYADPDNEPVDPGPAQVGGTPEDRRSTIARRVHGNGDRVDLLADAVVRITRRLNAILDAVEL